MFSYALSTASNYFHLPVDEQEDKEIVSYERKYLTWTAEPSSSSPSFGSGPMSPPAPSTAPADDDQHPCESKKIEILNGVLANDDLYQVLGVSKAASFDKLTLRKAYLSRSRACHPDKFPVNHATATLAFQKVAVAYNILSNPASKRMYDSRPPSLNYDVFAVRPSGFAEETFRGVVIGIFNDFLDGDLEVIKTFLRAVSDIHPALGLGEDGIDSVLLLLHSIRERALSCRTSLYTLHDQFYRLLEVKEEMQRLSYFDLFGRSRLTIQLTRITLRIPLAVETALLEQKTLYGTDVVDPERTVILLPRHLATLIQAIDFGLSKLERIFK